MPAWLPQISGFVHNGWGTGQQSNGKDIDHVPVAFASGAHYAASASKILFWQPCSHVPEFYYSVAFFLQLGCLPAVTPPGRRCRKIPARSHLVLLLLKILR